MLQILGVECHGNHPLPQLLPQTCSVCDGVDTTGSGVAAQCVQSHARVWSGALKLVNEL